jgi:hypothetical protein
MPRHNNIHAFIHENHFGFLDSLTPSIAIFYAWRALCIMIPEFISQIHKQDIYPDSLAFHTEN